MSDPTEDMVRREISEAVRILKEDGMHVTSHMRRLLDERFPAEKETTEETKEPGEGDPPPAGETKPPVTETKKARSHLWFGDRT